MYKEERDALAEEMVNTDACDMDKFGSSERTIATLGDKLVVTDGETGSRCDR